MSASVTVGRAGVHPAGLTNLDRPWTSLLRFLCTLLFCIGGSTNADRQSLSLFVLLAFCFSGCSSRTARPYRRKAPNPALPSVLPTILGLFTNSADAPSPRDLQTAVWTGKEMIVWGGSGANGDYLNTGARYNPTTDTWTPMSTAGAPDVRGYHTAIWTSTEMIVWGGISGRELLDSGGRYDPVTDTWTAMSAAKAPAGTTLSHGSLDRRRNDRLGRISWSQYRRPLRSSDGHLGGHQHGLGSHRPIRPYGGVDGQGNDCQGRNRQRCLSQYRIQVRSDDGHLDRNDDGACLNGSILATPICSKRLRQCPRIDTACP